MGLPMARRLLSGGWRLVVWARRQAAAQPLLDEGASWANDPAQLAHSCDRLVLMLRGSDDVRELVSAMLPAVRSGTTLIDMTTAAPAIAAPLAADLATRGVHWLDCPVTGGVAGARDGRLTLFAGGSEEVLEACRALLDRLGQRTVPCGGPGSGYRMKLVNQILMAGALLGLAEGASLARHYGLSADKVRAALDGGSGSSWMFNAYIERMIDREESVGFTLAMLHKDLQLAKDAAVDLGIDGHLLLRHALDAIARAMERHGPAAGIQTLAW